MNKPNHTPYNKSCNEQPTDCLFRFAEYRQGESFEHGKEDAHYIVYCRRGTTKLRSNLFNEEVIYGGEILFLPRMADCSGVALSDVTLLMHRFNNTLCSAEKCILTYLYSRRNLKDDTHLCKLSATDSMQILMNSIVAYIESNTHDDNLWRMKHKELIWTLPTAIRPRCYMHSFIRTSCYNEKA